MTTVSTFTPFAVITAPAVNFGGLCYNSVNDALYYFTSNDIIIRLPVLTTMPQTVVDIVGNMDSNMVICQSDSKIYFYDDNGGAGNYIIYNINLDGSGSKNVVLDNVFTRINTFDLLTK